MIRKCATCSIPKRFTSAYKDCLTCRTVQKGREKHSKLGRFIAESVWKSIQGGVA